jgi:hypothetical protein
MITQNSVELKENQIWFHDKNGNSSCCIWDQDIRAVRFCFYDTTEIQILTKDGKKYLFKLDGELKMDHPLIQRLRNYLFNVCPFRRMEGEEERYQFCKEAGIPASYLELGYASTRDFKYDETPWDDWDRFDYEYVDSNVEFTVDEEICSHCKKRKGCTIDHFSIDACRSRFEPELLPCPFCGNDSLSYNYPTPYGTPAVWWSDVSCSCGVRMSVKGKDPRLVVKQWNQRK